jgi:hypothetical protein
MADLTETTFWRRLRDYIIGAGQAFDPLPISPTTFEQDDHEALRKDVEAAIGDLSGHVDD